MAKYNWWKCKRKRDWNFVTGQWEFRSLTTDTGTYTIQIPDGLEYIIANITLPILGPVTPPRPEGHQPVG